MISSTAFVAKGGSGTTGASFSSSLFKVWSKAEDAQFDEVSLDSAFTVSSSFISSLIFCLVSSPKTFLQASFLNSF